MRASIKDLKNNLSAYIKKVQLGEELIITLHHHAVAKLVPITEEAVAETDWNLFVKQIHELHHKLGKVKLKTSMRETVLKQRDQERS